MSGRGDAIATGSYNNLFRVFGAWNGTDMTLEASRDPMRKRLQAPAKVSGKLACSVMPALTMSCPRTKESSARTARWE
jgi:hypothetical protein